MKPSAEERRQDESILTLAEHGLVDMLSAALDEAHVDTVYSSGDTLLVAACRAGQHEVVKLLVERRAAIDLRTTPPVSYEAWLFSDSTGDSMWQRTPLAVAAAKGHVSIVEILLAARAAVDEPTDLGWTPLAWASQNGFAECVERLLDARANVNARFDDDAKGYVSLRGSNPRQTVLRLLLLPRTAALLLLLMLMPPFRVAQPKTPLITASYWGHDEIARLLLRGKADVDAQTERGCTALFMAAVTGAEPAGQVLCRAGARVDLAGAYPSEAAGCVPSLYAVASNAVRTVLCHHV
jgi:ankyrin repeat protein